MRAKQQAPAQSASPSAPNVFWRAISLDRLQLVHPRRFVPLPENVALAAAAAAGRDADAAGAAAAALSPYCRQGTPAWALLRRGAATTASLPEIVGLRLHTTPPAGGRRRGGGGGKSGGSKTTAAAEAERRRQAALARLRLPPATADELEAALQGTGGRVVVDPNEAASAAAPNEAARAALFAERSSSGGAGSDGASAAASLDERREQQRAYCRAVLLRAASLSSPEVAVRLAWGQAQEAAALEAVLRAFPKARVEEVGAFFFSGGGGGGGDGDGGNLRVGASPDALISHPPVKWRGEDLREAAEAWRRQRQQDDDEAGARRAARLVLLRRALDRAAKGDGEGEAQDHSSPPPLVLLPLSAAAGAPDARAQLDAAVDAALAAAANTAPDDANSPSSTFDQAALSLPPFHPREAVEVKNHSPFKLKGRSKARGGSWRLEFSRPQPQRRAERLRPQWLLQAQAHALCCGIGSSLVVSRCALAGSRVFRVLADEAYHRELLALLALDCEGGGVGGGGGDAASERRAAFGERTRKMADAVGMEAVVAEVPPPEGAAPEAEAFV